jgi:hypothetical protein
MSELAVSLLRLSYLALLWLFVLAALAVLRRDTYGTKILRREANPASLRRGRRKRVAAPPVPIPAGVPHPATPQTVPRTPRSTSSAADAVPASDPTRPATPRPAPSAPQRLVVTSGPLKGTSLPLGHAVTIGRSATSNLVLDDEFTSGRHALIEWRDGRWYVEDLGSTNGTFIGRQRIGVPTPVEPGQVIRVGQTRVELR